MSLWNSELSRGNETLESLELFTFGWDHKKKSEFFVEVWLQIKLVNEIKKAVCVCTGFQLSYFFIQLFCKLFLLFSSMVLNVLKLFHLMFHLFLFSWLKSKYIFNFLNLNLCFFYIFDFRFINFFESGILNMCLTNINFWLRLEKNRLTHPD